MLPTSPGKESPVTFSIHRDGIGNLLGLLRDLSGEQVIDAAGELPTISVFAKEVPWDELYAAVLGSAGLRMRRTPGVMVIERAPVFGVKAPAPSVAAQKAVPSAEASPFGTVASAAVAVNQLELAAITESADRRTGWMSTPRGSLLAFRAGDRLWNGAVERIEPDHVILSEWISDPLSPERARTRKLELAPLR